MWSADGSEPGQVSARMETSLPMGTTSISVSQQQPPKKFAPVVAPKPKFNPYKPPGEGAEGDYPPPPPPVADASGLPSPSSFPPPPPMGGSPLGFQVKGPEKTLEERRSSLDAEIDSLTSILADLESSSPYKPRSQQNSSPAVTSPSSAAPVTGYKRMVIPTQPPLTATKKSTPKAQGSPAPPGAPPASASPVAKPQFQMAAATPQPVPASYTTASTPSQPTFNVQVRAAQPGPQHPPVQQQYGQPMVLQQSMRGSAPVQYMPAQPRGPDFAYGPPQPGFTPAMPPQPSYADYTYGGGQNTWRGEPQGQAGYQPPTPKKTYITEPPVGLTPYTTGPPVPQKAPVGGRPGARPEEELERLTKKMLYDMDHPPTEEYFGRCASCGENVVGEGTGCTAMDQVFHVDCFVCMTCTAKLRGKPFYAVDKKAYCEPCYIDCGTLLSEGDNQGCYPLDGHVLCKNCNTSRIQALTAKATTDL
ncbi:lipoma-preferred partner isoform X3 [Sardina pilchardus]|uniref:lipoma-preferred partner isoform X3 n=1 Tax=Sardina pilchardus TaxID=27697 RepID=UPI002E12E775